MFESGMGRSRIDQISDPKLMDIVEPLEGKRIDQILFKFIERDESMDRIVNLFFGLKKIFNHIVRIMRFNPHEKQPLTPRISGPREALVDVGSADLNKLGLPLQFLD